MCKQITFVKKNFLIYYLLINLFILLVFVSCHVRHTTITHCTPYFTKANQFESNINLGGTGINGSVAYSPIKYLSLQSSVFAFRPMGGNYHPEKFTNYLEFGGGLYFPINPRLLFSINGGYGIGSTDWTYRGLIGISGYTIKDARFDSKKTFILAYLILNESEESKRLTGFSVKFNFFKDYYYHAEADAGNLNINGTNKFDCFEVTYFLKKRIANKLYFNLNIGAAIIDDPAETINPLCRMGFILKL